MKIIEKNTQIHNIVQKLSSNKLFYYKQVIAIKQVITIKRDFQFKFK